MCADGKDVPAGERAPEPRDAVCVDPVELARIGDRGYVVLVLPGDVEQLARFAGAGPKVAVVEHEGGDALLREALGVRVKAHLARAREAVCHDNERQWSVGIRAVEPRSAAQPAGRELDVVTRERHALAPLGSEPD